MDRLTATNRLNDGGRLLVENPQAADLDAPLTNSIIPQRGVGAVSYTRATIATVTDHEWVIRNCISGEARFQGARRIHNLTTYSQEANSWNKFSVTVSWTKVAYTDGSLIGQTVVSAAASAVHYISNGTWPVIIWNKYIFSVSVKAAWVNFVQLAFAASTTYQNFDLTNGSMTGTAGAGSVVSEWDGWYRCSVTFISTLGTNAGQGIVIISSMSDGRLAANLWDGVSGISVCRMQLEDVTGQSVQTAGEYVSTNVLNATPYHGANVDGVKYFNTTLAWLPISPSTLKGYLCEWTRTNLFLQSEDFSTTWAITGGWSMTTNIWIAPDGKNTMDLFIPSVTAGLQYISQSVTTSASVYVYSVYVKANGYNLVQLWASWSISSWYVNFDVSTGTVTASSLWTGSIQSVWNGIYRCTATTNTVTAATSVFVLQPIATPTTPRATPFTGDWVSGLLVWWAQLELWPNVSSYIPTTTTTVTRNIDVLTYGVKNVIANQWALSSIIHLNDSEQFDRRAVALSSFTINRLHVQARSVWSSDLNITYWDGVTVRQVTGVAAWTNNIAVAWTNWVWLNLYMNNIKYIGAFVPSLTFSTIDVGCGTIWYSLFWCVKNVRIWKTLPTDAELLSLSNQS